MEERKSQLDKPLLKRYGHKRGNRDEGVRDQECACPPSEDTELTPVFTLLHHGVQPVLLKVDFSNLINCLLVHHHKDNKHTGTQVSLKQPLEQEVLVALTKSCAV